MKARISIYAIVLAAGMLTALADEPKTNTPTGTTTGIPANTNETAVPPAMATTPAPAPPVVHKVKPPVAVPLTPTSAVPAQPKIAAAPPATTNAITTPPPMTTSTSAPAIGNEVSAPEDESLMPTNAVPAQSNITTTPPPGSSGISLKRLLAMSAVMVVVVGALTVFLLRRQHTTDHASLITRAMVEHKDEDLGRPEEKPEEKHGDTEEIRKFPPPMT